MAEKVTKMMIIKVDLACDKCHRKIKCILCGIPQIQDQLFDYDNNTITIRVVCCNPEKIKKMISCKGGKTVKSIEIVPDPVPICKPSPPPPEELQQPPCEPIIEKIPVPKPIPIPAPIPAPIPIPIPVTKPPPEPEPEPESESESDSEPESEEFESESEPETEPVKPLPVPIPVPVPRPVQLPAPAPVPRPVQLPAPAPVPRPVPVPVPVPAPVPVPVPKPTPIPIPVPVKPPEPPILATPSIFGRCCCQCCCCCWDGERSQGSWCEPRSSWWSVGRSTGDCCRECREGRGGGPCWVENGNRHRGGGCCRECSEGRGGGPCWVGHGSGGSAADGHSHSNDWYGRPVYEKWDGGPPPRPYRTRCTDYICEENPNSCFIM